MPTFISPPSQYAYLLSYYPCISIQPISSVMTSVFFIGLLDKHIWLLTHGWRTQCLLNMTGYDFTVQNTEYNIMQKTWKYMTVIVQHVVEWNYWQYHQWPFETAYAYPSLPHTFNWDWKICPGTAFLSLEYLNQCTKSIRWPYLGSYDLNWELCMHRNYSSHDLHYTIL